MPGRGALVVFPGTGLGTLLGDDGCTESAHPLVDGEISAIDTWDDRGREFFITYVRSGKTWMATFSLEATESRDSVVTCF